MDKSVHNVTNNQFRKKCAVCKKPFLSRRFDKEICSFECRQVARRFKAREYRRIRKGFKIKKAMPNPNKNHYEVKIKHNGDLTRCAVCGYDLTVDWHHYGKKTAVIALCPNHHALVSRGILTLEVY